ncbi:MAG: DUF5050 domain-containing protein [Chloroflexi bacterium]|nr:DUF5050 domain-containing protein [Chloroflexota bacterium]
MQRIGLLFASTLLILVSTLVVARRADPESAWIAFVSHDNGQSDVWRMRTDGTDLKRLTYTSLREFALSWSPDASRLMLSIEARRRSHDRTLQILTVRTGEISPFLGDIGAYDTPEWSPDGSQILFTNRTTGELRRLYRAGMTGEASLINTALAPNYAPKWSTDGEWIVFSGAVNYEHLNLYRMRSDGSAIQQLTDNGDNDSQPALSPDGTSLVYVRYREAKSELFRLDLATSNLQNLTFSDVYSLNPSWSGDGAWIVYATNRDHNFEIYRVRPDGSDTQRLTYRPANDMYPVFSPIVDKHWAGEWLVVVLAGAMVVGLRRMVR